MSLRRRLMRKRWVQQYAFQGPFQWFGILGLAIGMFMPAHGVTLWIGVALLGFFVLSFVVGMFCDITLSMARAQREAQVRRELFERERQRDDL